MNSPVQIQPQERGAAMTPPQSQGGLKDVIADLNHGAPRRVLTDALDTFARSLPPGSKVLEVGAGHYDHRPFFNGGLVRLDMDPTHDVDIVGDALAMPIDDDAFDAAIAISVLEHVDDPYQVARELFRVTKPGGRVFAWVPFFFAVHAFPSDISRFTTEGLQRCFEMAGFEVEHASAEPYNGLFQNLSNGVHFTFARRSGRLSYRIANRVLFLLTRLLYPLDRRLKARTMYSGSEIVARKPSRDAA
jgi:SAM-dependent methyltransferase